MTSLGCFACNPSGWAYTQVVNPDLLQTWTFHAPSISRFLVSRCPARSMVVPSAVSVRREVQTFRHTIKVLSSDHRATPEVP
jgi:hypothetical protein